MAMRFALNGIDNSAVSIEMKCAFKNFVNNKILHMKVKKAQGPLALCDLWDENGKNAFDIIKDAGVESYPEPLNLMRGSHEVRVSYVYSCNRFYVQLKSKEEDLNTLMVSLQNKSMGLPKLSKDMLKPGQPCLALYEADNQWYRAQILQVNPNGVLVRYVDYGNEETVTAGNLKCLEVEQVISLRPQALECSLTGYQNMQPDQERDNLLEELILENEFTMKVVEAQDSRAIVDLIDADRYNVNSLLLDKIAAATSQVSPMLVHENHTIEHRRKSSSGNIVEEKKKQKNENDWRQNKNRSVFLFY